MKNQISQIKISKANVEDLLEKINLWLKSVDPEKSIEAVYDENKEPLLLQEPKCRIHPLYNSSFTENNAAIMITGKYSNRCMPLCIGDTIEMQKNEIRISTQRMEVEFSKKDGMPMTVFYPATNIIRVVPQYRHNAKQKQKVYFLIDQVYELASMERERNDFEREFISPWEKDAAVYSEQMEMDAYEPFEDFIYEHMNHCEEENDFTLFPATFCFSWAFDAVEKCKVSAFLNLEEGTISFTDEMHDVIFDNFFDLYRLANEDDHEEEEEEMNMNIFDEWGDDFFDE